MTGSLALEQLLTLKQVAEMVQVSVITLRRAIRSGALKHERVGKRGQIRVFERSVQDWTKARNGATHGGIPTSTRQSTKSPASKRAAIRASGVHNVRHGHVGNTANYRILTADVMDGLKSLETGSVSMWVTSPPYYWQRDYGVEGQIGHEPTIDGYVGALVNAFDEAKRVLQDDGLLFLNLGDAYYNAKGKPHGRDKKHSARQLARQKLRAVDGPGLGLPRKSLIGLPWRVALGLQHRGWILRSSVMWQRPNSLGEPTSHDRPWRTTENVFIFAKSVRYFFNRAGLAGQEDIWTIPARPHNPYAHCAPFPVELATRCIECGCKPGGIVGDMFMGSGTSGVAALQTRRSFVGIEINDEYALTAERRIQAALGTHNNSKRRLAA